MKWSLNPKANNQSYASNKTAGYKRRVAGVKEATGSMEGAWDPASPAIAVIDPGTAVTLKLYVNATQFYEVPSVIDDFRLDVDLDSGAIVGWAANFGSNGAWTNPIAGLVLPEGLFPDEGGLPEEGLSFEPAAPLQDETIPAPAPGGVLAAQQVERIAQQVSQSMMGGLQTMIADMVRQAVRSELSSLGAFQQQQDAAGTAAAPAAAEAAPSTA